MVFLDRSPDRDVRHLEWRVRLFGAGAIVGLVGMYFDAGWMIWIAVGILLAGFGLRFLGTEGSDGNGGEGESSE